MSKISFHKVTASPTAPYAPNALYFFKSGTGFDLLLTDSAGEAIFGLNKPSTTIASTSLESNDLKAIAALTGATGLLRKTAAGTWSLDTSAYLTGISAKMVTDALNYTPVNPSVLGKADGIATLDAGGKVPSAQLPSFVDDVVDVANFASLPATGEKSKIYLLETPHSVGGITSSQFRWSGTAYAPIAASPGSTDAVTEGSTNLYFTPARARAAVTSITGNAATATTATNQSGGTVNATTGSFSGAVSANAGIGGSVRRGSYGSMSLNGSLNGYSGLDLFDQSTTWMTNIAGGVSFGAYKNNSSWAFYFNENGVLSVGTVPGASVSGAVASAGNAGTVGGLAVHADRNNEANKVVRTDANGYIQAGWINTDSGDNGRTGIARIYASQDSYLRYYTPGNFIAALNSSAYSREVNGGTLVPGTRYSIYTAGGAVTMALPAVASTNIGDEIEISNLHQTWGASTPFNITCPGGVLINMLSETLVCNHNVGGFTLVCVWKDGNSVAYWTVRT